MGEVIKTKVVGDKLIHSVELAEDDALTLEGNMKNVHMFSFELCEIDSKIMEKGKDRRVKYFVLPTKLKSKSKNRLKIESIQKFDTGAKSIFVYVCEKDILKEDEDESTNKE